MLLRGAKHERLFLLIDRVHEHANALLLAGLDLDDLVEVLLFVPPPGLDIAFQHRVVRRIHVIVERGRDLPNLEGREEPVVDALPQRIDVHRLVEIGVGVEVILTLGRGRQAQLHGGLEVLQDVSPRALVAGPTAVALVDDDEVKEVRRVVAEVRA